MKRPLVETFADHEPHIVAGLGIIIGAIAVSAIFYVAVIPVWDAAADATAQFIRSIRHG